MKVPGLVFILEIREGFDVSTRSSIFKQSNRVGSFAILISPNSPTISVSLLCFAVVCYPSRCQVDFDRRK